MGKPQRERSLAENEARAVTENGGDENAVPKLVSGLFFLDVFSPGWAA